MDIGQDGSFLFSATPAPADNRLKRHTQFLNEFASVHPLRYVPEDADFCPIKSVRLVIYCLTMATRSLPLFQLRVTNFITKGRKVVHWMKQWLRNRDRNIQEIYDNWVFSEETQRKELQKKLYKECRTRRDQMGSDLRSYVRLHSTKDAKMTAVAWLYWKKRDIFRKKMRNWFAALRNLRSEIRHTEKVIAVVGNSMELTSKLGLLQMELQRCEQQTRPTFSFTLASVPLSELTYALSKSQSDAGSVGDTSTSSPPLEASDTGDAMCPHETLPSVKVTTSRRESDNLATNSSPMSPQSDSGPSGPPGIGSPLSSPSTSLASISSSSKPTTRASMTPKKMVRFGKSSSLNNVGDGFSSHSSFRNTQQPSPKIPARVPATLPPTSSPLSSFGSNLIPASSSDSSLMTSWQSFGASPPPRAVNMTVDHGLSVGVTSTPAAKNRLFDPKPEGNSLPHPTASASPIGTSPFKKSCGKLEPLRPLSSLASSPVATVNVSSPPMRIGTPALGLVAGGKPGIRSPPLGPSNVSSPPLPPAAIAMGMALPGLELSSGFTSNANWRPLNTVPTQYKPLRAPANHKNGPPRV